MSDTLRDEEKPPSPLPRPARPWKVAVLANIKEHDKPLPEGVPPDAGADFDYIETVDHIRAAIETDGHKTLFIQADTNLPFELMPNRLLNRLMATSSSWGHRRKLTDSADQSCHLCCTD